MRYLSQRDPSWAQVKMGASSLTLGGFGCTTTCISMLTDYFGSYKSPLQLAHNAANYTSSGLILWTKLNLLSPKPGAGCKFVFRDYKDDRSRILEALRNKDKAVILEVPMPKASKHWVVAAGKSIFSDDLMIVDPWDGKKKSLKSSYKIITGAAFFERI